MSYETGAMTGQGTKFYRNNVEIAEINSIGGPSMSRETIDVTVLAVIDGYRKFIGGLRDAGNLTLNMNFTRAGYLAMKADFESDDVQTYSMELPDEDETEFSFSGLVTELPVNIPVGEKIAMDVTIKISGKVDVDGESTD